MPNRISTISSGSTWLAGAMWFGAAKREEMENRRKVEDIIDLLCQVPFFNHFSREQIESLGLASSIIKVPAGKVIVTEGDIEEALVLIDRGLEATAKKTDLAEEER